MSPAPRWRLNAGHAVLPHGVVSPASILVEDGGIVAAGPPQEVGLTPAWEVVERPLAWVVPGFVDLQVNGVAGHDFHTAEPAGVAAAAAALRSGGVAAACPTLVSAPLDRLLAALGRLAAGWPQRGHPRLVGIHLEGPFLNPARRGAHSALALRMPDVGWMEGVLDQSAARVAICTLAPELPGAMEVIRRLVARGVAVSIGHTEASYAQAVAAEGAGARLVTHLFNAQRGLGHREPGTAGAALERAGLRAGLILDLVHVSEPVVRIAAAAMGDRLFAVSDGTAAGRPPGHPAIASGVTSLGGEPAVLVDGAPHRDGVLAGSAATMEHCFAHALRLFGWQGAVAMCSANPAAAAALDDLGTIAAGRRAFLLLMDDAGELVEVLDGPPAP